MKPPSGNPGRTGPGAVRSQPGRRRVLCSRTNEIDVQPVILCLRGLPKSMDRPGYRRGPTWGHLDVLGGSLLIRLIGAGFAFGLNMLVARLAGAEQYGIYSYVLACLGLLALLATAGMDVATVKYVAAYLATGAWTRLRGLLVWSRRLVLTLAFLIGGLGALVAVVTWDRLGVALASTLAAGCAALPFLALLRLNEARLEGHGRVILAQIPGNILRPAVVAAAAALVTWLPPRSLSAAEAMTLQAVALGAAYVSSALLVRRTCPSPPTGTGVDYAKTEWMHVALPLWTAAVLHVLTARIDTLLVGTLRGMTEAGIYAVANRTTELIVFGANAGQAAVRPYVSAFHAGGRKTELQRTVTTASWAGAAFAAPVCAVLLFWGPEVLGLFGSEFAEGRPCRGRAGHRLLLRSVHVHGRHGDEHGGPAARQHEGPRGLVGSQSPPRLRCSLAPWHHRRGRRVQHPDGHAVSRQPVRRAAYACHRGVRLPEQRPPLTPTGEVPDGARIERAEPPRVSLAGPGIRPNDAEAGRRMLSCAAS